jgi:benzoyl-CoA reductase subunit C
VIRNLSGMWQILFKDKYVRYIDVPQNYEDAVGGKFYRQEMQILRDDLGQAARAPITDAELNASIASTTRTAPRSATSTPTAPQALAGADLRGLPAAARRHGAAGRGAHGLVREYLAAAEKLQRPKRDNARVVINGSFCEQPPLALIKSIEMSGCYIVDDDFMLVTRWLLDDVPADGDPLLELARAFLHRSASTAAKYDARREDKGVFLLHQVKQRGAEGVIFAAPSFCDPALLERPMLQDVLASQGVPYTAFKYAENTGQMAPIREQAGTFADSIKLWSATA